MKYLTIAVLMVASFGLVGNANAGENGHAYNGSFCKSWYGSQSSSFQHQNSGIKNVSSGGRWASCPVIVDEIAKTTGTTRTWLYYTGSGKVSCTLFSKNHNGVTRQAKFGSRTGTGWFSIPRITTDHYWGSYSMDCYIPRAGKLNTIWVGEQS